MPIQYGSTNSKESVMKDNLKQNFEWFLGNRDDLLKSYNGKSVVIVDCAVVANFPDDFSAAEFAQENFETGKFIVQSVSLNPSSYVATVSSVEVIR